MSKRRKKVEASARTSMRAWQKKILAERRVSAGVDSETSSAGMGPLTLDVAMARKHGWTEEAIRRTVRAIEALAKKEGGYARRRYPDRYTTAPDGTVVFVGDLTPEAQAKIRRAYARAK